MTADIELYGGDLSVIKVDESEQREDLYDLALESHVSDQMIRRCVETPIGYLGRFGLDEEGLDYGDGDFGNPIYARLAEPFTVSWISGANADIKQALKFTDSNTTVSSVNLSVGFPNTLYVDINYSVGDKESSTTLPLQL